MKYLFLVSFCFYSVLSLGQTNTQKTTHTAKDSFMMEQSRVMEKKKKEAVGTYFQEFYGLVEGQPFSSLQLKGKTVFINFWFASCKPCIAEFPYLNELYQRLKDTAAFEFISFTFESPEKIQEVKRRYGLEFKVIAVSQDECYRLNGGLGFPTNMVIDRKGIIKYLGPGEEDWALDTSDFILTKLHSIILQEL